MTSVELRSEIVQMIKSERDTSILEAIRTLLYKLREVEQDDLTDEEVAELDKRRAHRLSGQSKGHSAKGSIRMLRASQAKDEAI